MSCPRPPSGLRPVGGGLSGWIGTALRLFHVFGQARLGPGRIHHCMRLIGMTERALDLMIDRALSRTTFGQPLAHRADIQDWIAESRVDLEMIRLLTMKVAYDMDTVGNNEAWTGWRA